MDYIKTADPMVIMRYKGRVRSSQNLLITEAAYYTIRICTTLPLQEINIYDRGIKIWRVVTITKIPVDDYGFRQNPDFFSGIYMALVMEYQ